MKREMNIKRNLFSQCIDHGFKKVRKIKLHIKQFYLILWNVEKIQKVKTRW